MKIKDVFRIRIVVFFIQILVLSLFISLMSYEVNIHLDVGILEEQTVIIQLLANYLLFNRISGLFFIFFIWIVVSLIPIFMYNDLKKAYAMNLLTYFFPNFFLYVFLWRYSPEYFDFYFQFHFINTILLGMIIVGLSTGLSLILKKIMTGKKKTQTADLEAIASSITTICPNCGTIFESIPKICYNCNADLTIKIEDKRG